MPTLSVLREGKMFHCVIGKRWNGSAESKNLSMRRNFIRENRETLPASKDGQQPSLERSVNAHGGNADMHAERESDGCVVPAKSANNGEQCFSAESMEGRQPAKRNIEQAPWTGLRTGLLGHEDCSVFEKLRKRIRSYDSTTCFITSAWN